jgi:hypothetical protein
MQLGLGSFGTTAKGSSTVQRSRRGLTLLSSVVAVTALTGCVGDTRDEIDLASMFETDPTSGFAEIIHGGHEITDQFCDGEVPCVQAYTSDEVRMTKFETKDEADAYAETLDEVSHLSNWIVLDFSAGSVDAETREAIESGVDGLHTSGD